MQVQLNAMLDLQNSMNSKVNEDWPRQNFAWYRAIWVECAELLDHYGWKWWKKQQPDVAQVRLELIDIWHFGLSILLMASDDRAELVKQLEAAFTASQPRVAEPEEFRSELETFALATLSTKSFDVVGFAKLVSLANMSFDELYSGYVGKNVLNFFRQDNGYKDGSYRKLWAGREDNEHLVEAVVELDSDCEDFADQLYSALQQRYQQG